MLKWKIPSLFGKIQSLMKTVYRIHSNRVILFALKLASVVSFFLKKITE